MVTIQQIDAAGLHVMAWVEGEIVKIKTLTLAQLQPEHDLHHAMLNPIDPANHDWPVPHMVAIILAKKRALADAIANLKI
jgi:hypothetical protein